MNPLVSFLIPTLWRLDKLKASIRSIRDTADNPEQVQIITRCHECDLSTRDYLTGNKDVQIVLIGSDKPAGKGNEWLWNQMYRHATGTWLTWWSDDQTLKGMGWDTQLSQINDQMCVVHPEIHQLNTSVYVKDERGPVPFMQREFIHRDIESLPDFYVHEEFVLKRKWPIHWLFGVTVFHDRDESDRTCKRA